MDTFLYLITNKLKQSLGTQSIQERKRLRSTLPFKHSSNMLSNTFPEGKLLTDQDRRSTKQTISPLSIRSCGESISVRWPGHSYDDKTLTKSIHPSISHTYLWTYLYPPSSKSFIHGVAKPNSGGPKTMTENVFITCWLLHNTPHSLYSPIL